MIDFSDTCFECRFMKWVINFSVYCKIHNKRIGNRKEIVEKKKRKCSKYEKEAVKSLDLKFTSGNKIPVERATILRSEWTAIKYILAEYMEELQRRKKDARCPHCGVNADGYNEFLTKKRKKIHAP